MQGIGHELAVRKDEHGHGGVDPAAMIGEDGGDGGRIAGGDCLPESEVPGQDLDGLQQTLTILVQQAAQDAFADIELLRVSVACDADADGIDEHQYACLHHRKQQGEDKCHAAAEAAKLHPKASPL